MRVVGGSAKGRQLESVPGDSTRPILDRVKTALFDILRPEIAGLKVLDLFAGSGSVGIEALSQGAAHCTFIDVAPAAVKTISKNLEKCDLSDQAEVRNQDAFTFMRATRKHFDLIYVAPPQYKSIWVEMLHCIAERPEVLTESGQVIAQIDPREYEALALGALVEARRKKYGNTELVFFGRC